jgi:hypothetical protein
MGLDMISYQLNTTDNLVLPLATGARLVRALNFPWRAMSVGTKGVCWRLFSVAGISFGLGRAVTKPVD